MNNDYVTDLIEQKITKYRSLKTTESIKAIIDRLSDYSCYILNSLKKNYKTFIGTMMIVFRVVLCWLKSNPSESSPKEWVMKRTEIINRLFKKQFVPELDRPLKTNYRIDTSLESPTKTIT